MAWDYRRERRLAILTQDEFERRFRTAFGRDMTLDERRFYQHASIVLDSHDSELSDQPQDFPTRSKAA